MLMQLTPYNALIDHGNYLRGALLPIERIGRIEALLIIPPLMERMPHSTLAMATLEAHRVRK